MKDFTLQDLKEYLVFIPFIIIVSLGLLLLGLPLASLIGIGIYAIIGLTVTFFTYTAGGVPPAFFIILWPFILLFIGIAFIVNKFL